MGVSASDPVLQKGNNPMDVWEDLHSPAKLSQYQWSDIPVFVYLSIGRKPIREHLGISFLDLLIEKIPYLLVAQAIHLLKAHMPTSPGAALHGHQNWYLPLSTPATLARFLLSPYIGIILLYNPLKTIAGIPGPPWPF